LVTIVTNNNYDSKTMWGELLVENVTFEEHSMLPRLRGAHSCSPKLTPTN